LDAETNYTRVEGKFTRNDAVKNSVGKRIPYISRDVVNFGLTFKWRKLDFSPSGTYHSKQFLTADNTDTVNGVQGAYDAYTTFSAKVGYKLPTGQIYAGVENIFNKRYYLQYLNPGRTFNVGTKINIL
jgi:iron complex outermembrane receptor protein